MSLYNMLFGVNPLASACLFALGLRPQEVGRFRDAFIENGEIVVLTRNGGGNRDCSHTGGIGNVDCKNHREERMVAKRHETAVGGMVVVDFTKEPFQVKEEVYVCEHPDSEDCACYGCIQRFRLPKHPCYLRDEDDSYDSTYARTYFKFPEELAPVLEELTKVAKANGIEGTSDLKARFEKAIKDIETNGPPEALKPVGEKLAEVLGEKKE